MKVGLARRTIRPPEPGEAFAEGLIVYVRMPDVVAMRLYPSINLHDFAGCWRLVDGVPRVVSVNADLRLLRAKAVLDDGTIEFEEVP